MPETRQPAAGKGWEPLAPPEEAFTLLGGACMACAVLSPVPGTAAILGGIIATNITPDWMGRGGWKLLSGTHVGNRFIRSLTFRKARARMAPGEPAPSGRRRSQAAFCSSAR